MKCARIKAAFEGGFFVYLVVDSSCGAGADDMSDHLFTNRWMPAFTLVLVFMAALLSSLIWYSFQSPLGDSLS